MDNGWVKLHRKFFNDPLWLAETFTKGQAWADLFGNANHKPRKRWIRGVEISLARGQIGWSEVTMSKRWKWSRNKVRRFLKWLELSQQIEQQKNTVTSVITILNYDKYQPGETANLPANETTERHQTEHKQECKEVKDLNNTPLPPKVGSKKKFKLSPEKQKAFDIFWNMNIRKKGKAQAEITWDKLFPEEISLEKAIALLKEDLPEFRKRDIDKVPHPSSWLNSRYKDDVAVVEEEQSELDIRKDTEVPE